MGSMLIYTKFIERRILACKMILKSQNNTQTTESFEPVTLFQDYVFKNAQPQPRYCCD